ALGESIEEERHGGLPASEGRTMDLMRYLYSTKQLHQVCGRTPSRCRLPALSATAYQAHDDKGPDTADLAARFKALKAANTLEAAPQRLQRKQAAAEEPVTARIRRRQKENASAGEIVQLGQPEAANDNFHADNDNQQPTPEFIGQAADLPGAHRPGAATPR
ncbi:MAG: hypothetical protein ACYC3I_17710, partial [Gemmataceae bacterium]